MVTLNDKQKQASEFMFGTASVICIPGAGKTTTMAARIGNLVQNGISPRKILGLTFTRNAAGAMREKLRPVLGDQASSVTLSTIHSFCHRVLKQEGRKFSILYGKRQVNLMHRVIKKTQIGKVAPGFALREISLAKVDLIDPDRFCQIHENDETMEQVGYVYRAYENEKRKRMLLDFDDLLVVVYSLLQSSDDIRKCYQKAFPHILVDEYQDTNQVQLKILNLLARHSDHSSFWVCGDDCQSIFGFTGARVENILLFEELHPTSVRFILDINYRSSPQILQVCQHLIDHNQRKIHKALSTLNPDGEKVIVLSAFSETDEADRIVSEIKDLVEVQGFKHKDIAVLYRANNQSQAIEEGFSRHGIGYRIESDLNFYNRDEVSILLNYLRIVYEPDSLEADIALKAIINVPIRYIGHGFIETLESFAEKQGVHLYPALKLIPVSVSYLRQGIDEFIKLIDGMIEAGDWMEPVDLIDHIREKLNIDQYLAEKTGDLFEESREHLNQLQMAAEAYEHLGDFLKHVESISNHSIHDENGVTLSTIHKAKGLEFPVVFVIGMIEGIIPNAKGDIEEERRIAFVAMSRAMRLLYLSYSMTYSRRTAQRSSFIAEALQEKEVMKP